MSDIDLVPGRAAHRLYVHVVWPTLGRIPLVSRTGRGVLERHLIVLCRRLDTEPLLIRVFSDRAHLLLRFKPGHSVASVVSRLKEGSETALGAAGHTVRWGRGYAAATIGRDDVRRAKRRILRLGDSVGSAPARVPSGSPHHARRSGRRSGGTSVDAPGASR
jgi:REP element-mobilizing transposase RayT